MASPQADCGGSPMYFATVHPQKEQQKSLHPVSHFQAREYGNKSHRYKLCKTHVRVKQDAVRAYRHTETVESSPGYLSKKSESGYWIHSPQARLCFILVVLLNTLYLSLVVFLQGAGLPAIPNSGSPFLATPGVYTGFETVFFLIFITELVLRYRGSERGHFFKDRWNRYDMLVLALCFTDAVVLTFIPAASTAHQMLLLLMPTFQILRLGREAQELRMLLKGIWRAMRAVLWALFLLLLVIYSFAVISLTYVSNVPAIQTTLVNIGYGQAFSSVTETMYTLFTFVTLSDYVTTVRSLLRAGSAGVPLAIGSLAFILFTNMACLNLVTAVMVDSIIDILPKTRTEKLAQEHALLVKRLESMFVKMDRNGDRQLTLQEFQEGVTSVDEVRNELSRLQIASMDVQELFMLIDFNDNGTVSVDEFIEGLMRFGPGPASKKELLGLQYDMHKMWNMLGSGQERMMSCLGDELSERLSMLERHLESELAQQLTEHLTTSLTQHLSQHLCEQLTEQFTQKLAAQTAQLAAYTQQLTEHTTKMLSAQVQLTKAQVQESHESLTKSFEGTGLPKLPRRLEKVEQAVAAMPHVFNVGFEELNGYQQKTLQALAELPDVLQSGQEQLHLDALQQVLERVAAAKTTDAPNKAIEVQGEATDEALEMLPQLVHKGTLQELTKDECQHIEECRQVLSRSLSTALSEASPSPLKLRSRTAQSFHKEPSETFPTAGQQDPSYPSCVSTGLPADSALLQGGPEPMASPASPSTPSEPISHHHHHHHPEHNAFSQWRARYTPRGSGVSTLVAPEADFHPSTPRPPTVVVEIVGEPNCCPDFKLRVGAVRHWVYQRGLARMPFDKLVLVLEMHGIQLSCMEQDLLKSALSSPCSAAMPPDHR